MSKVTITIEGEVGSGKSALLGRIAKMLEYLEIPVTYDDPDEARSERNSTSDNWESELKLYQPSVHLVEKVVARPSVPVATPTIKELFDQRKQNMTEAKKDMDAELKRQIAKRKFLEHMKKTSEIVDSWPEWKKNWKP